MPNGMSFTMPGWNLDISERGFDKALVLERNGSRTSLERFWL
ncbi:hypothetical protein MNB_SM-4-129 [hydrothermal vent metagenome]|uniref:Uncharacterized protein n=1 Tax=hydrothermal vent metagenome TaxID=652676 RepID=A0A1W1CSR7_9ZZZZ